VFSQRVKQIMEGERLLVATPQSSVSDAARLMAGDDVGAVVVVEKDQVVGIFTGRDVVRRVLATGADPQTTSVASVMTAAPMTIDADKSFGQALRLMQENHFRHLPVLEAGKLVGIVSSRNVLDPEMEEFTSEVQRRESFRSP
jgi:CBS domain-containing protein